ncbi:MAG: hypothetical protein SFW36_10080 [Leptolyngbyaceae cyanobacterium bins.59]|nr:hypothetical protein [Leptolyngbyaceae cyanobacterium bins.59]
MTQDVTQWLAEIKSLQQQLAQAQQERNEAYASAANWRKLYETEAQQRRTDALLNQERLTSLELEISRLKGSGAKPPSATFDGGTAASEIEQLPPEELKARLLKILTERDQLTEELKVERKAHLQTRKSLTTALGDTVDLLARERAKSNADQPENV